MNALKNKVQPGMNVIAGLFSKKEAALQIAGGNRHVHSSILGQKDPLVTLSENTATLGRDIKYPWESMSPVCTANIFSSKKRRECIDGICTDLHIDGKRTLKEKIELVLEELVTNGIYHAYLRANGDEKYQRTTAIELPKEESISISYALSGDGIYLSVKDKGGGVSFDKISKAFNRCYTNKTEEQMERKEGGAGLGLYLVFETVTHLKVLSRKSEGTTISCWIANRTSFDPDHFSFNYFEEEKNK